MLSDRELGKDAIKELGGAKLIERADAPTAKQIAVIWVDQDGLAPVSQGISANILIKLSKIRSIFRLLGL